jgi:hypothetical protein
MPQIYAVQKSKVMAIPHEVSYETLIEVEDIDKQR